MKRFLAQETALKWELEKSCKETEKAIEKSCLESHSVIKQMRFPAKEHIQLLEEQANEREKQRHKKLDDKLASIPSESRVDEWAHTVTHDYLNMPSSFDTITTTCSTANSSITASSEKGTTNIRNEAATAIKGVTDAQRKAMRSI